MATTSANITIDKIIKANLTTIAPAAQNATTIANKAQILANATILKPAADKPLDPLPWDWIHWLVYLLAALFILMTAAFMIFCIFQHIATHWPEDESNVSDLTSPREYRNDKKRRRKKAKHISCLFCKNTLNIPTCSYIVICFFLLQIKCQPEKIQEQQCRLDSNTNFPDGFLCGRSYANKTSVLDCKFAINLPRTVRNCSDELRQNPVEFCGMQLKLDGDNANFGRVSQIALGQWTSNCRSKEPFLELILINLNLQRQDTFPRISDEEERRIKVLKFLRPKNMITINKILKELHFIEDLTIGDFQLEEDTELATTSILNLVQIHFQDGKLRKLPSHFIFIPAPVKSHQDPRANSKKSLELIEFVNTQIDHLPSNAIVFNGCRGLKVKFVDNNLSEQSVSRDFLRNLACVYGSPSEQKTNNISLLFEDQQFRPRIAPNVLGTMQDLMKLGFSIELTHSDVDCCRKSEGIEEFMGKMNQVKLLLKCADLGRQASSFSTQKEFMSACEEIKVFPVITVAIVSIILVALLIVGFAFMWIWYIVPKRARPIMTMRSSDLHQSPSGNESIATQRSHEVEMKAHEKQDHKKHAHTINSLPKPPKVKSPSQPSTLLTTPVKTTRSALNSTKSAGGPSSPAAMHQQHSGKSVATAATGPEPQSSLLSGPATKRRSSALAKHKTIPSNQHQHQHQIMSDNSTHRSPTQ